jgi:23S rRNA-/tRNA-specific pseudouridylate synthase
MPVVGDVRYGGPAFAYGGPTFADGLHAFAGAGEGESGGTDRDRPIALHALSIRFRDPDTAEERILAAPLPTSWPAAAADLLARS